MLRSVLFDVAFLGFGGALLVASIDLLGSMIFLAIGLAAVRAMSAAPQPRVLWGTGSRSRWGERVRFA
jgi:hypothetical protein